MSNPHRNPAGGFATEPVDDMTAQLRAAVADALQPGNSPKKAEFWNEVLADHIRNRNRKAAGLDPLVSRWDRNAPEMRVIVMMEERVAA